MTTWWRNRGQKWEISVFRQNVFCLSTTTPDWVQKYIWPKMFCRKKFQRFQFESAGWRLKLVRLNARSGWAVNRKNSRALAEINVRFFLRLRIFAGKRKKVEFPQITAAVGKSRPGHPWFWICRNRHFVKRSFKIIGLFRSVASNCQDNVNQTYNWNIWPKKIF